MTVWKLSYQHNEFGNVVSYHPTRRLAENEFKAAVNAAELQHYDVCNPLYQKLRLSFTRKSVIDFLNHHTPSTDNG